MRAIEYVRYGLPEGLSVVEHTRPRVADNEVLVRVRGASVNAADWFMLTGAPWPVRFMCGFWKPTTRRLGLDLAGEVAAVGARVTRFRVGEAVFGEARGTFAEYAVAKEAHLAHKPDGVSFEAAATLAVAGCTALQGLRDKARVKPGSRVLVNGASGGVGSFAVEIACSLGAQVTAVCSARNAKRASELGAIRVLDYAHEDFSEDVGCYDAIFDVVGRTPLRRCLRALRPTGVYVSSSGRMGRIVSAGLASLVPGSRVRVLAAQPSAGDLQELAKLVLRGELRPWIERVYRLDEVPLAMRSQGEGHAGGKLLVAP